jgi:hypothetical protein
MRRHVLALLHTSRIIYTELRHLPFQLTTFHASEPTKVQIWARNLPAWARESVEAVRFEVAYYFYCTTTGYDYMSPQWMSEKEMALMDVLPALKMVEFEAHILPELEHRNRGPSIGDAWVVKKVKEANPRVKCAVTATALKHDPTKEQSAFSREFVRDMQLYGID